MSLKPIPSKWLVRAAVCAASLLGLCVANAQDAWPKQPVKLVVPWPAGGVADFLGRLVAKSLTKQLGQPVIVEDKPGAGTNIGSDYVAKASPDGYTLLLASSNNAVNMSLFPSNPYDTSKDFAPVGLIGYTPMVLVANPGVPASDLRAFIRNAKANPGKVTVATAGNGSPSHLAAVGFERSAKVKLSIIPYKGAAPAVTDVIGGQVQALFTNVPASLSQIQAGKLKAYAITGTTHNAALPKVPTFAEAGLADYDASGWYGMVAPKGTPQPVVQRLAHALAKTMTDPAFVQTVAREGVDLAPVSSPSKFAALIDRDINRYRQLIADAGVKID